MARVCLAAVLCMGVLCGLVAAQSTGNSPSTTPKGTPNPGGPTNPANANQQQNSNTTTAVTEPAAEPEPEPEAEPEAEPSPTPSKPKASSSNQKSGSGNDSGAAGVSVSFPSLMVAVVFAKLYAH